jgi:flagellar assembly protein FliH
MLTANENGKDPFAPSMGEAAQRSFEAGRARGLEEGRQLGRADLSAQLREVEKKRIESIAQVSEQLARERDSFLHAVEPEVVKLALSIASRILRHEAQMDPLFLAGAVRVALGQLAETIPVRLRVPAADFKLWSETIAHLPNLRARPTIIADSEMLLGDCVIETDMGSVDLGLRSQLKEIDRGFFEGVSSRGAQESSASKSEKSGDLR